jgi:hypothetical protein
MPGFVDAMDSRGQVFQPTSPTAAFGDLIQISRQGLQTFWSVDPLTGPHPAESSPNQPVSMIGLRPL